MLPSLVVIMAVEERMHVCGNLRGFRHVRCSVSGRS